MDNENEPTSKETNADDLMLEAIAKVLLFDLFFRKVIIALFIVATFLSLGIIYFLLIGTTAYPIVFKYIKTDNLTLMIVLSFTSFIVMALCLYMIIRKYFLFLERLIFDNSKK